MFIGQFSRLQLGEENNQYLTPGDTYGEDSHDYVNGFYSSISNDDLNYQHFKRKTAERSSTFFRGLLPTTRHQQH